MNTERPVNALAAERLMAAKNTLKERGYTCVIITDSTLYASNKRGVAPLLDYLEKSDPQSDAVAADKVVGKAAAFLYVLLGVKAVYAGLLSRHAQAVFERYGIYFEAECVVDAIRNRTDTGFCPMESAVMDIEEPKVAYDAIRIKLKELSLQAPKA